MIKGYSVPWYFSWIENYKLNIPAIMANSIQYPTNFKLLLFLINAQVNLKFHEKPEFWKITAVFLILFHRSSLLFNNLKTSNGWHRESWFKNNVLWVVFLILSKISLLVPTKLRYEMLNIKVKNCLKMV